ncbi:MAG: hypothetical protein QM673_10725 [Gordonia sp. (in: high G+C Gram-positive bacteria)]
MTSIQVADEMFVAAAPELAADVVGDRGSWRRWWPDLRLDVTEDRGIAGVRWKVAGELDGTMEIWCEPVLDGFVLHYFLHAEPAARSEQTIESLAALNHRFRVRGKKVSFEIKDRLESGRDIGDRAVAGAQGTGG